MKNKSFEIDSSSVFYRVSDAGNAGLFFSEGGEAVTGGFECSPIVWQEGIDPALGTGYGNPCGVEIPVTDAEKLGIPQEI